MRRDEMNYMRHILTALLALLGALPCKAQDALPPVEELMTSAQFHASGLNKLSAVELKNLNTWLLEYTLRVVKLVSNETSNGSDLSTPNVVESQIDGDFEGWEGETIFKLTNGQIWQQSQYAYHYHYAFMPRVVIVKTHVGYKMQVEGVSSTIMVRRIK
jgi:hypothetical protein